MDSDQFQNQLAEWQRQWEQDMFAQSLLSKPLNSEDLVDESKQEEQLQRLLKQFPHVQDSIVIDTYFEQTNCNFQEAVKLLKLQFPEDPAFKVEEEKR